MDYFDLFGREKKFLFQFNIEYNNYEYLTDKNIYNIIIFISESEESYIYLNYYDILDYRVNELYRKGLLITNIFLKILKKYINIFKPNINYKEYKEYDFDFHIDITFDLFLNILKSFKLKKFRNLNLINNNKFIKNIIIIKDNIKYNIELFYIRDILINIRNHNYNISGKNLVKINKKLCLIKDFINENTNNKNKFIKKKINELNLFDISINYYRENDLKRKIYEIEYNKNKKLREDNILFIIDGIELEDLED